MGKPMIMLTPEENAEVDEWWASQPKKAPPSFPDPRMAIITCRVCDGRAEVPIDHAAMLCPACMADVPGTQARITAALDTIEQQDHAAFEAWQHEIAALDDATTERWTALVGMRVQVTGRLRRAETAPMGAAQTVAARLAEIEDAKAAVIAFESKVARTAAQPGNSLTPVLRAEATYYQQSERLRLERQRWEIAQQEIASLSCPLPF